MSENVTEPIKATWKTSYFRIFVVTAVAGIPFLIGMVWLANTVLPPADAEAFKKPLFTFWAGAMAFVGSAAGLASLKGALMRTEGKIATQIEQEKKLPPGWVRTMDADGNPIIVKLPMTEAKEQAE